MLIRFLEKKSREIDVIITVILEKSKVILSRCNNVFDFESFKVNHYINNYR